LNIIDSLIKSAKNDARLAKMALAVAELLLAPLWFIILDYEEQGLSASDIAPSVNFTTDHILAFHDAMFSRSNHQLTGVGIGATQIVLEEVGFDESKQSPLDSLDYDIKYDFKGPSGKYYPGHDPRSSMNLYSPLQMLIHKRITMESTTWDAESQLTVEEIRDFRDDPLAMECCQRLLSFPPETPFEVGWADWLPGWVFSNSKHPGEVEAKRQMWRQRWSSGDRSGP
jgi:hypothetical protein